jgi:transposase
MLAEHHSPHVEALLDYLLDKPGSYLDKMVDFILNLFAVKVSTSSLRRVLKKIWWSKKSMQQRAKEQNPDLRDEYWHDISRIFFMSTSLWDKISQLFIL